MNDHSSFTSEIIDIEQLLKLDLYIPNYQRTYSWSIINVDQLFNDILNACKNNLSEYRIGTIVIHEEKEHLNIVDGQQRTLSLTLINNIIEGNELSLSNSNSNIYKNYHHIKRLYNNLTDNEKAKYNQYFKERCKVICIVITDIMTAFQFFDSQNSRGKALETHDLLKAYHLRAMKGDNQADKLNYVTYWEEIETEKLVILFKTYLYPIIKWSNGEDAHYFDTESLKLFKGISLDNNYRYVKFQKAAHLYIENNNEKVESAYLQFQLDQPIISGRRFFQYVKHYIALQKDCIKYADEYTDKFFSDDYSTGTRYVKELYIALLMYYYDRFGVEVIERNKVIEQLFYRYCYQLRIALHAVSQKSINKYALGRHHFNQNINIFKLIKTSFETSELEKIHIHIDNKYIKENYAKNSEIISNLGASNEKEERHKNYFYK